MSSVSHRSPTSHALVDTIFRCTGHHTDGWGFYAAVESNRVAGYRCIHHYSALRGWPALWGLFCLFSGRGNALLSYRSSKKNPVAPAEEDRRQTSALHRRAHVGCRNRQEHSHIMLTDRWSPRQWKLTLPVWRGPKRSMGDNYFKWSQRRTETVLFHLCTRGAWSDPAWWISFV